LACGTVFDERGATRGSSGTQHKLYKLESAAVVALAGACPNRECFNSRPFLLIVIIILNLEDDITRQLEG